MQRPKSCLLLFSDAKNTEDYCSVHNSINEIHEFREEKDEKFFFCSFVGCAQQQIVVGKDTKNKCNYGKMCIKG